MNERQTLSMIANQLRMSTSRATVRSFDDEHLMQQIKQADVYHSETPSDFERWQMVGLTATPLDQDEEDKQQQNKKGNDADDGDWNHDQPKGPAAEAVMLYPGAQRNHPIAIVDDRRVRPYKVPKGASAMYAASGTGQMLYHNDEGSSLIATNNPKYGKDQQQKERYASLRHVNKKPQERKLDKQGDQGGGSSPSISVLAAESSGSSSQPYKHEGEEVNSEVRCTSNRIEFRIGDTVVGHYDKGTSTWTLIGKVKLGSEDANHPVYGNNEGIGKTTKADGTGAVLVKAPEPGPKVSEDV